MTGTLSRAWWLLALCGIADALHAAINLLMINPYLLRRFALTFVWDMGVLALFAGACAIAAGIWSAGRDNSWLLSLHGFAFSAFGAVAVSRLVKGPLSFRPLSILFLVTAVSIGAFAFKTAMMRRHGRGGSRFLLAAGAASIGFALSFPVVGFWTRLEPPQMYFVWMSSYLAFCALFMMWLAFRVHSRGLSPYGQTRPLPPPLDLPAC